MFDPREAIAIYRGWQALEQRLPPQERISVIDFDLVPHLRDSEHLRSRDEVLQRIERLRDSVEVIDDQSDFIRARLDASACYIRAISGQHFEFYEYLRRLLGITPELVSLDVVRHQAETLNGLLKRRGVRFQNDKVEVASFQNFDASLRIDIKDAKLEVERSIANFLPQVTALLGVARPDMSFRVEFVEREEYWLAWASGSEDDYVLRFNFHPIHKWRRGDMEYLALHEVCGHFLHAAILAGRIRERKVNPFLGITTVHDPHTFMDEGIADALAYFFPEDIVLTEDGLLAMTQRNLRDYLNNNAHILANMGWPDDELIKSLLHNPFTTEEQAQLNLTSWRSDPLLRAYQYSYGIALKFHRSFSLRMSRTAKIQYMRHAFSSCLTPARLIDYANMLIAD